MPDRDQEIIDSLRRAYEAFNRGDFDAVVEIAHPEVEMVRPGGQTLEIREFRINGNKVLVRQHTWGRGAGSGIEMELDMWVVWTLNDDGLATRVELFLPGEDTEAFEAGGLSE